MMNIQSSLWNKESYVFVKSQMEMIENLNHSIKGTQIMYEPI